MCVPGRSGDTIIETWILNTLLTPKYLSENLKRHFSVFNSSATLFLRKENGPISVPAMSMLIFFFCLAQYFLLLRNIPLILKFSLTLN